MTHHRPTRNIPYTHFCAVCITNVSIGKNKGKFYFLVMYRQLYRTSIECQTRLTHLLLKLYAVPGLLFFSPSFKGFDTSGAPNVCPNL